MPAISTESIHPLLTPRAGRAGGLLGRSVLLAVAAIALPATPAIAASQQVQVTDFAFVTPGVAVTPGESVTWRYLSGGDHHNVVFDDGSFANPPSPLIGPWTTMRSFPTAGAYRYFCQEHGGPGGQGMSGIVYVNAGGTVPGSAPTASFTVSSTLVTVGQNVSLNAAASTEPDPGDSILRYEWDLDGSGSFETEGGNQPTKLSAYQSPGMRNIGLRVTDGQGHTSTATRAVTVTNAPLASFTVTPGSAQTGQSVSFDGSASSDPDGTIAKYEWDLDGDGSYETDTGTTAAASRAYATPASLTIGLRITDNLGVTALTSRGLQVSAPAPPAPPPPPPVTPPSPGGPSADTSKPSLSAFSLAPSAFKAKASGSSVATSSGTLVKYRLSEAATTTFTVQRVEKGRKKGRACQKPARSNRSGARCTRYVTIRGSFKHAGASSKLNSVRFSGRIGGRKLAPARYRMRAVARDASGNTSAVKTANFRITR